MIYDKRMGNVGNKLESAASSVYHGISNDVDSVGKFIGSLPSTASHIIDKTEDSVVHIVDKTEDNVTGIVKTGEYSIMLPLAALGIGLAIMLGRSNSNTVQSLGSAAINKI